MISWTIVKGIIAIFALDAHSPVWLSRVDARQSTMLLSLPFLVVSLHWQALTHGASLLQPQEW